MRSGLSHHPRLYVRVSGANGAYRLRCSSPSLCTFSATIALRRTSLRITLSISRGGASLNSPDFSIRLSTESCNNLQPPALPTELPRNLSRKSPKLGQSCKDLVSLGVMTSMFYLQSIILGNSAPYWTEPSAFLPVAETRAVILIFRSPP
jgi:hypothetical protein